MLSLCTCSQNPITTPISASMTNTETNKNSEGDSDRAELASFQLDMPFILRQIRLCRSTLGAILEELEGWDQRPNLVEAFGDSATTVAAEIDSFWGIVKRSALASSGGEFAKN